MKKYEIEYDYCSLATVEIDESKATEPIKDMVKFWTDWEEEVEKCGSNYTQVWLKNLAMFILRNHRIPQDDEGWVSFDERFGITIKFWSSWEPDEDLISIKENIK
jgi:hypothetical protein